MIVFRSPWHALLGLAAAVVIALPKDLHANAGAGARDWKPEPATQRSALPALDTVDLAFALFKRPGDSKPRHPEAEVRVLAWSEVEYPGRDYPNNELCLLLVRYTEVDGRERWILANVYRNPSNRGDSRTSPGGWARATAIPESGSLTQHFESKPTFNQAEEFLFRTQNYIGPQPNWDYQRRVRSVVPSETWRETFGGVPASHPN
jgi:hypothetical protein